MIQDFFNSSGLVEQITTSSTAMGGVKKSYSTRIASLNCRVTVTPKTISEADEFGKMTLRGAWRLYCEATTANKAIIESDRITVDSRQFEVTGIGNPGMLDRHLEVDLIEIR